MKAYWQEFVQFSMDKKIVCYGAGVNAFLMLMKKSFHPFLDNILFFVDKDEKKSGTKLVSKERTFDIYPLSALDEISKDTIIIVTISDYISTGKMLDEKGLQWYPWTVISTDINFSELRDRKPGIKQYFLLNTPDYMNLGDHAITVAEYNYLNSIADNYYELGSNICHAEGLKLLSSCVEQQDVIFVQGGGNMGSLWRVCEENIRNIVRLFPKNKIVIFPQSVYYGNTPEELEYFRESRNVYDSHNDLLICSRDRRSFEFTLNSYKCKSMLLPDMAMTIEHKNEKIRNGVGLLFRDDKEKYLNGDYRSMTEAVVKKLGKELKLISHHPVMDTSDRRSIIGELLELYSSCELVITDRLHGMILSAVTDTPCIAFDNSYHKVSDLYKTWLKVCGHITFSEQLSENDLTGLVLKKLSEKYSCYNAEIYRKEFDKLTSYLRIN